MLRCSAPIELRDFRRLKNITPEAKRVGIYFLVLRGEIMYVGQSRDANNRIRRHRRDPRMPHFDEVFFLPVKAGRLLAAEKLFIRGLAPPHNQNGHRGQPFPRCLEAIKKWIDHGPPPPLW